MRFSIVVMGHPERGQSSQSAWQFCSAALENEHQVVQVFFLHDATYQAFVEDGLSEAWRILSQQHSFNLDVCVTAMEARNQLDEELLEGFTARGLGQLVDATIQADRTITFR